MRKGSRTPLRRLLRSLWIRDGAGRVLPPTLLGFRVEEDARTVTDQLYDFPVTYDLRSEIGRALFLQGAFEEAEILFFVRLLSSIEHPVILDIGANIGLHAIRWARACPSSVVWAFEPSERAGGSLRRNVGRSGVSSRVHVVEEAMADAEGIRNFHETDDDAYGSLRDTRRKPVVQIREVPTTTVDLFAAREAIARVDLIKIDVEGLEREVLTGALATIQRSRPSLFVEVYGGTDSNPDPEATIADVVAQGYRPWVLVNGVARPYEQHEDRLYNYYFEPLPG